MESLQTIKGRLKAVNNIGKITRAMEVVAATKMRRAQELAIGSRPYAFQVLKLLSRLTSHKTPEAPILTSRDIKRTLLVVVSSDRGLVGSFNNQLLRATADFVKTNNLAGGSFEILAIGKKALQFADKFGWNISKSFLNFGNMSKPEQVGELSEIIISGFLSGRWDKVSAISMNFKSTLAQVAIARQILPASFEMIKRTVSEIVPESGRYSDLVTLSDFENDEAVDYIFEPSKEQIFKDLLPHLIKMQIYHLMLEANASEHSARRVAMKTASDNADEVAGKLSLDYNKVRQANITRELIEITSTQAAL